MGVVWVVFADASAAPALDVPRVAPPKVTF
jgi:hypothetical protein